MKSLLGEEPHSGTDKAGGQEKGHSYRDEA